MNETKSPWRAFNDFTGQPINTEILVGWFIPGNPDRIEHGFYGDKKATPSHHVHQDDWAKQPTHWMPMPPAPAKPRTKFHKWWINRGYAIFLPRDKQDANEAFQAGQAAGPDELDAEQKITPEAPMDIEARPAFNRWWNNYAPNHHAFGSEKFSLAIAAWKAAVAWQKAQPIKISLSPEQDKQVKIDTIHTADGPISVYAGGKLTEKSFDAFIIGRVRDWKNNGMIEWRTSKEIGMYLSFPESKMAFEMVKNFLES